MTTILLEIDNIGQARQQLQNLVGQKIILSNKPNSIYYLGIKVIDQMFKILRQEFITITSCIINAEDCQMSVLSAVQLNYYNINYTGNSKEIQKILNNL